MLLQINYAYFSLTQVVLNSLITKLRSPFTNFDFFFSIFLMVSVYVLANMPSLYNLSTSLRFSA
jgi:hypothetical protein